MCSDIPPVFNPVFQERSTLKEIIEEASYALEDGILTKNVLQRLFGEYHNTLVVKLAAEV